MREIIETICEGGMGGEATVFVQLRNVFPGIGGEITTSQTLAAALREEFDGAPAGTGNRLFLKHVIMKKLDDYFCRTGKYTFPHVARPLGSLGKHTGNKEAYLYEWVRGASSFPWEYPTAEGREELVTLDEWSEFIAAFENIGIRASRDVADADNGRMSQNIVHELPQVKEYSMNLLWKRIDFGDRSLTIEHDTLKEYLVSESEGLQSVLGIDRYDLLILAQRYLTEGGRMEERELGKLDMLARSYRISTLSHNKTYAVAMR